MSTSDALRVQQELLHAAQRQIHGTGHAVDTSTFECVCVTFDRFCAVSVFFIRVACCSGFANSSAYRNIIVELPSPSKAAKKAHTAARNTYTIGVPKPSPLPTPTASLKPPVPMPSPMASSPLASSPLASSPSSSASPSAFTFSPKHIRSAAQNMLSPGQQMQQPDLVSPRRAATDPKTAALINRPQRVEPPAEMHAPSRRDPWSSLAMSATPGAVPASPVALTVSHSATVAQNERQQLTDLALLATACHRGGRVRGEAFNYFCMGILHDNLSENLKAISCYQKFAKLCEMSNDRAGLLLSYNAIGVSYQALGPEYYGDALQYHEQHVESPDLHDKFVAHTNMGLIFASCQVFLLTSSHCFLGDCFKISMDLLSATI
jgi:hypothetical protein